MKNYLLSLLCLSFFTLSTAADTTRLKPTRGTWTTQVGLSIGSFYDNVNSLGINARYFVRDRIALRASVNMNQQTDVENVDEDPTGSGGSGKFTTKEMITFLNIGIEKHCGGTRRLSPYGGAELGYGMGTLKEVGDKSDGSTYIPDYSEESKRQFSQIQVMTFLGFDYWLTDGLYIGMEYSILGYFTFKEKRSAISVTQGGMTNKTYRPEMKASGMTTTLAFPVFRFGWRF